MFSSRVRGEKAYTAEQKIGEFKKLFFQRKQLYKATSTKPLNPKKTNSKGDRKYKYYPVKNYSYTPDAVKENKKFRDIFDFYRLIKVKQHLERREYADIRKDKKLHKKLKEPLKIGEKGAGVSRTFEKMDAPGNLYKSTTNNIILQP